MLLIPYIQLGIHILTPWHHPRLDYILFLPQSVLQYVILHKHISTNNMQHNADHYWVCFMCHQWHHSCFSTLFYIEKYDPIILLKNIIESVSQRIISTGWIKSLLTSLITCLTELVKISLFALYWNNNIVIIFLPKNLVYHINIGKNWKNSAVSLLSLKHTPPKS